MNNTNEQIQEKLAEVEKLLLSVDMDANVQNYLLFEIRKLKDDISLEIIEKVTIL